MSRRSSILSLLRPLLTLCCSLFAAVQAQPLDAEGHPWWPELP